ncbi:MAG: M42 family metallopeptidase [Chloroflexi bacterium]|nr:M42 family metallopeptidase [Chloroflexota bacterium]
MYELVKALTELPGMIGYEEPVQAFLQKRWTPRCQEVWETGVGNVVARVGGQGPKLLVEAHADEIGALVAAISEQGMIWLSSKNPRAGRPGRDVHYLGHPAVIQTDKGLVEGIFAALSGHVTPPDLRDKPDLRWGDFFVDIGAKSRSEAQEWGVRVGDGVIWNPTTRRLGHYIVGKAMDDRAALAIMTALLERLDPAELKYDLYLASTVQEELGLVGAYSLERDVRFDLGIAVDVGLASDVPGVDVRELNVVLGGGPILVHHDQGVHYDRKLTRALGQVAGEVGIPVQDAVFPRYGSDGQAMIQGGLPAALLAFPTRYTHSPYEMLHERDLEQCVDLLHAFLVRPPVRR